MRQHHSRGAKGGYSFAFSESHLWLLKVIHISCLMALNSSSEQTVLCCLQGLYQKTPFLISEEKPSGDLLGKFGFIQIIRSNVPSPNSSACVFHLTCKVICSHVPKSRNVGILGAHYSARTETIEKLTWRWYCYMAF